MFALSVKSFDKPPDRIGKYTPIDDWFWPLNIRNFFTHFFKNILKTVMSIHLIFQATGGTTGEEEEDWLSTNITRIPWINVGHAVGRLPHLTCLTFHITRQNDNRVWKHPSTGLESGIRRDMLLGFEKAQEHRIRPLSWTLDGTCFHKYADLRRI